MAYKRRHLAWVGLTLVMGASAHGQQGAPESPAPADAAAPQALYGYAASAREATQGAWGGANMRQEAALWKSLCAARPADVGARMNWFRSERNTRLAGNNGRLNRADADTLEQIAAGIQRTAPGSFEHHLSNYYLRFPGAGAADELLAARQLAPDRPELMLPLFNLAHTQGNKAALDEACARLEEAGGLAPGLMLVARDLLRSVDERAVLFTNGDMDAAPAIVQQRRHDMRRDVLVIDQRLLADAGYRAQAWRDAGAGGPVPAAGPAFARALLATSTRPLFLALSLDPTWFDAFPGQLCATGIAFAVRPDGPCRMADLEQRWNAMNKSTAAGPLSRNYLLPGALLLQHFRTDPAGEGRAAQLELELRRMGSALGATRELIQAGVLPH